MKKFSFIIFLTLLTASAFSNNNPLQNLLQKQPQFLNFIKKKYRQSALSRKFQIL